MTRRSWAARLFAGFVAAALKPKAPSPCSVADGSRTLSNALSIDYDRSAYVRSFDHEHLSLRELVDCGTCPPFGIVRMTYPNINHPSYRRQ